MADDLPFSQHPFAHAAAWTHFTRRHPRNDDAFWGVLKQHGFDRERDPAVIPDVDTDHEYAHVTFSHPKLGAVTLHYPRNPKEGSWNYVHQWAYVPAHLLTRHDWTSDHPDISIGDTHEELNATLSHKAHPPLLRLRRSNRFRRTESLITKRVQESRTDFSKYGGQHTERPPGAREVGVNDPTPALDAAIDAIMRSRHGDGEDWVRMGQLSAMDRHREMMDEPGHPAPHQAYPDLHRALGRAGFVQRQGRPHVYTNRRVPWNWNTAGPHHVIVHPNGDITNLTVHDEGWGNEHHVPASEALGWLHDRYMRR